MLDREKHQNLLTQIFSDIYSRVSLAPLLGFKGGTALYFFHQLSRFSVDLDFDLLDLDQSELVIKELGDLLSKYGDIKNLLNKRLSIQGVLSYGAGLQKIKIDISKRNYCSSYEIKQFNGISALVMVPEDLFSNKLIATINRKSLAIRDLYDLNFMFNKLWSYNPQIIHRVLGLSGAELITQIIHRIETSSSENILSAIGVLLNDQDKAYVKDRLKSDLLFSLRAHLSFIDV